MKKIVVYSFALILAAAASMAAPAPVAAASISYTALQDQTLCVTTKYGFTAEWLGATKGCPTGQTCSTADGASVFLPVCIPADAVNTPNYTDAASCANNCATQCYKNDRPDAPLYYCGPALPTTKTTAVTGQPNTATTQTTAATQTTLTQPAQFVPLAPIPGLTQGATADQKGLADFLNNLYKYLVGLAAVIAVVEIIIGGLEISTQDSVAKNQNGKTRIQQALLGLLLVLSPVIVFSIINPQILNLSANIPKLDTRPGTTVPTSNIGQPLTEVRNGSMNTAKVGQIIGYQEDYYAAPKSGGYCFQINASAVTDGKNYFCSGDPNGCRLVYNDFNKQKLAVTECAKAP